MAQEARSRLTFDEMFKNILLATAHRSPCHREQATVHAEQNAICDCAKRGVSCEGATAYITHYPCIICTRLLLASGIKDIKYLEDYKNDELVKTFTNELNVKVEKLI